MRNRYVLDFNNFKFMPALCLYWWGSFMEGVDVCKGKTTQKDFSKSA